MRNLRDGFRDSKQFTCGKSSRSQMSSIFKGFVSNIYNYFNIQHEVTHLPRNKSCFSCGDNCRFATYSAMFIHLENGCSTTIGELNRLARTCYQWKHYIDPIYTYYLMNDNFSPRPPAFRCPGCERTFSFLSSLVQHVESDSCSEGIHHGTGAIGKMIHFVSLRV